MFSENSQQHGPGRHVPAPAADLQPVRAHQRPGGGAPRTQRRGGCRVSPQKDEAQPRPRPAPFPAARGRASGNATAGTGGNLFFDPPVNGIGDSLTTRSGNRPPTI